MQQETVTFFVACLGITGTLGGIVVGHLLTRSWQRQQWVLDCRRQEFRELVSTLTTGVINIVVYKEARDAHLPHAEKLLDTIRDTHSDIYKVIADRIYIAKDIKALRLFERYCETLDEIREADHCSEPGDRMSALIEEVVELAIRG